MLSDIQASRALRRRPGIADVDLSAARIDIVNSFLPAHLASAVIAADSLRAQYVQLVSFGCGHDAYLPTRSAASLEGTLGRNGRCPSSSARSDVAGPLRIRVRSFIETVDERRAPKPAIKVRRQRKRDQLPQGSAFARPSAAATPTAARPLPRQVRQSRSAHQDHPRVQHLARVLPAHVGIVRPSGRAGRLA